MLRLFSRLKREPYRTAPLFQCNETILGVKDGKAVFLPENAKLNQNFAVIGGPGTGKTRCFVLNQLFQCVRRGESMLVIDLNGEFSCKMMRFLGKQGYTTVSLSGETLQYAGPAQTYSLAEMLASHKAVCFVRIWDAFEQPYDSATRYIAEYIANLYRAVIDYAVRTEQQACPVPVHFILDEFSNLGMIPDFANLLVVTRSRRIHTSIVFQSVKELEMIYPKNWTDILSYCDIQIIMGSSRFSGLYAFPDVETAMYFRKKIPKDLFMQQGECLVLPRGLAPFTAQKFDCTKHPFYRESGLDRK